MNSCLMNYVLFAPRERKRRARVWRGGGVLGLIFAGYVPLASQSPSSIIVYSVANYRPVSVTFGQMCNFPNPKLSYFLLMCLCEIE